MRYDNEAVGKYMDHIYDKTKNHPRFQDLYDKAAAKMMSLDREIGLCVLFSYDFLLLFKGCLEDFFKTPDDFNDKTPSFLLLKQKL
jgi:hypothetical protein